MCTAEDVYARRLVAEDPVQCRIGEDFCESPRLEGGCGGERARIQDGVGCVGRGGSGGGGDHGGGGVNAVEGAGGEGFGKVVGEDAVCGGLVGV